MDTVIEAIWCIHSETGEEFLIDCRTRQVLATRVEGQLVNSEGEDDGTEL